MIRNRLVELVVYLFQWIEKASTHAECIQLNIRFINLLLTSYLYLLIFRSKYRLGYPTKTQRPVRCKTPID